MRLVQGGHTHSLTHLYSDTVLTWSGGLASEVPRAACGAVIPSEGTSTWNGRAEEIDCSNCLRTRRYKATLPKDA